MRVDRTGIRERHARIERMTLEHQQAKKRRIVPAGAKQTKQPLSTERSPARLAALWLTAVAVIITGAMVLGADIGVGTGGVMLAVWLVPPAIVLFIGRGGSPNAALLPAVNKKGRA